MKYQIIVESDLNLADYEILEHFRRIVNSDEFKVLYAQNLQGIRKEVYERRQESPEKPSKVEQIADEMKTQIENLTDDEIKDLFDVT